MVCESQEKDEKGGEQIKLIYKYVYGINVMDKFTKSTLVRNGYQIDPILAMPGECELSI